MLANHIPKLYMACISCFQQFSHFELNFLTEAAVPSPNGVDLFGDSLIGDLMDAPTLVPAGKPDSNSPEVDLFADATFVTASPQMEKELNSPLKVLDVLGSLVMSLNSTIDTCS